MAAGPYKWYTTATARGANTGTRPQDWRHPVEVDLDGLSAHRQVDAAADDLAGLLKHQPDAVRGHGHVSLLVQLKRQVLAPAGRPGPGGRLPAGDFPPLLPGAVHSAIPFATATCEGLSAPVPSCRSLPWPVIASARAATAEAASPTK